MILNHRIGLIRFVVVCCFALPSSAYAIKKCQDADGNWHYGDFAVQECNKSKITTLDQRGFIKEEREAPMTEEEIAAQAENKRLEQERLEQEQAGLEERQRILSIYETEADIQRQRDNQSYSVQSNIDVTNAYIKSLQDRIERNKARLTPDTHSAFFEKLEAENTEIQSNIVDAQAQLVELNQTKKAVAERFDRELELYRKLRATGQ